MDREDNNQNNEFNQTEETTLKNRKDEELNRGKKPKKN